jgi:trigger factor
VPKGVGVQVPSSPCWIFILSGKATLKIETQALEDRQTKIIAEFDSETLEQYMRRAARKISSQARIPGFRPGKAPYDVVRRMYGDQAIQQEAVEIMLDEVYPQVLKEANIDPSGPGKLEEIISIDPPRFSFVIPLAPEVELGDYLNVRKEYAPEPITEEQIESTITRLQRSYSTAEPVERPAQVGDMVSFKMSAKRVNPEEGQPEELIDNSTYQMVAGEKDQQEQEEWPYEGFSQELVGLSANESKTWTHTFSEETTFEDLKGKEAEFTVEVQDIKAMELPELTDEFAQSLGEFQTLEELRTAIRTQLEQNYQQQYDSSYFNELINEVVSTSTVHYPPHLLDSEIEDFVHGVEHDLEHERLDLDTYLKMREMDRETFIETEVKPAAARRLERSLVLAEFARQEQIEVKEEEIRSIYFTALQQMQSSELKKIQTQNKRSAQDMANSIATSTINNIFNQRLMNRIKAIATGKADEPAEELTAAMPLDVEAEALSELTTLEAVEAETVDETAEVASSEEEATGEGTAEVSQPETENLDETDQAKDQTA